MTPPIASLSFIRHGLQPQPACPVSPPHPALPDPIAEARAEAEAEQGDCVTPSPP
jgi:hypothetical protein